MENPFRKPYSVRESSREKLAFVLLFGLFIFLFLFLFKPFGFWQIESKTQLLVSFGFGLVTIFVLLIFKFLIEPMVIKGNWTIGKSILWSLVIASSIGAANYFYISIIFPQIFMFKYFLVSIWTAILVGIIPATTGYIISYNRMIRAALQNANIDPVEYSWEPEVLITAGNSRNEFRINPKKIVYLCSNDNYVTIITASGELLNKQHLRGTLKAAEFELRKNSSFFRCHKCYIVNSEFIDHVSGNVQNMRLKLKIQGIEIPVSRQKSGEASRRFR